MVEKKKTVSKNVKNTKTAKASKTVRTSKLKDTQKISVSKKVNDNKNVYKPTKERVTAIVGLVVLSVFLIGLLVALITANGKLAMAMIFSLAFVSILLFIVLRLYK